MYQLKRKSRFLFIGFTIVIVLYIFNCLIFSPIPLYLDTTCQPIVDTNTVILTVKPGGRLGNAVFEYLSVWAWSKEIENCVAVIPEDILSKLETIFKRPNLPSLESLDEKCNNLNIIDKYNAVPSTGNYLFYEEAKNQNINKPLFIVLRKWIQSPKNVSKYWKDIKSELQLLPELETYSNNVLNKIRSDFIEKLKLKNDENIEYVGVHVRKTDYDAWIVDRNPNTKPADAGYYVQAMEEMREKLRPKNVIFVVISDDMLWCEQHFKNIPDVVLSAATGNPKNPKHDLAILCSCNHTIMAYGTFGLTSTFCHPNGHVIVYSGGKNYKSGGNEFARYLGWTILEN